MGWLVGGSLLEHRWGEIQAGVRPGVSAAGELTRQLTVPAAQIQQVIRGADPVEDANHPRL